MTRKKLKSISIKNFYKIYKTPILFTGGAMSQSMTQLIIGLVIAKFIPPEDLGLWTTLNLAVTYTSFMQAGLISGLNRELPYTLGQGNKKEAQNLAGTVQSITLITTILIFLAGILLFVFYQFNNDKIKYGLLSITIFIISLFFQNYFTSTYRSNNSFISLSKIQVTNAILNLLSLVLIIYFAYYGLILKSAIVSVLYTIHLYIARPISIRFTINKNYLIKIMKTGLPIWGLAYIESLASTMDKILLLKFSDLSSVGIYSFAFYGYSLFLVLSVTIAKYISPKLSFIYGMNNDKKQLWGYFKKITLLTILIQLPLALIAFLVMPYFTYSFFPQYIESIRAMQILVCAGMFKGSIIGVNVLISIKAFKYLSFYQITYSLLLLISPFVGIQIFENPIIGVSFGILFANILNFISGYYFTYIATIKRKY